MKGNFWNLVINLKAALLGLPITAALVGCQPGVEKEEEIYFNDFEDLQPGQIEGGEFITYNGSRMLGNYFRGGFTLKLDDLPEHDYLVITFDLYIHDSWDGNSYDSYTPIGPDMWYMELDGKAVIETSFSNGICNSAWCLQQSYPFNGRRMNNPGTGAHKKNLPSLCSSSQLVNNSALYRISRTVRHTSGSASIYFFDELVHPSPDKCDESWSLDNLRVSMIKLE